MGKCKYCGESVGLFRNEHEECKRQYQTGKEKIIENAQQTAEQMVEDTKNKSEFKLERAKKSLGIETMDIAVSIARGKIEKEISQEDDESLINQFLSGLDTVKGNFN